MPQDLTDDKSTLVQVMAWCRQATSHYLGQCWPISMSPNGATRPQLVKGVSTRTHQVPASFSWKVYGSAQSYMVYDQMWATSRRQNGMRNDVLSVSLNAVTKAIVLTHWPREFEWNFIYVIFKRILVTDGWGISCEIALIWMSLDFTDDQSTLVQVMAWWISAQSLWSYIKGLAWHQYSRAIESKKIQTFRQVLLIKINLCRVFVWTS